MKMKYTRPTYERIEIKSQDVLTASTENSAGIQGAGEATLNDITGKKGIVETLFDWIA